jgi:hypothetical protein
LPRSMIPVSRPYPPPREALWLKPQSPQFPSTFDNPFAQYPGSRIRPFRDASGAWRAARMEIRGINGQKEDRPEPRTSMVCRALDVSRPSGTGNASIRNRLFRVDDHRQPPLASGDSMLNLLSDRRRIVAQVRRKVPNCREFLGPKDSHTRCDDLLTTGVDSTDWAGL